MYCTLGKTVGTVVMNTIIEPNLSLYHGTQNSRLRLCRLSPMFSLIVFNFIKITSILKLFIFNHIIICKSFKKPAQHKRLQTAARQFKFWQFKRDYSNSDNSNSDNSNSDNSNLDNSNSDNSNSDNSYSKNSNFGQFKFRQLKFDNLTFKIRWLNLHICYNKQYIDIIICIKFCFLDLRY